MGIPFQNKVESEGSVYWGCASNGGKVGKARDKSAGGIRQNLLSGTSAAEASRRMGQNTPLIEGTNGRTASGSV